MITVMKSRYAAVRLLCVVALLLLGGCAQNPFATSSAPPPASGDIASMANTVGTFSDIELPADMQWDNAKSMAISTDSFKGGVYRYSGRVELASLKDFISTAMQNKKWKLVGEAQSQNVMMAFTKPSKTCIVVLSEGLGGAFGKTMATLYVAEDVAAAGQLNPFGEPVK